MKDHEIRKGFQKAVDRRLTGLQGSPDLAWKIINQEEGGPIVMKKKMSFALVFAMAAVLIAGVALAVGLSFSPQYDAVKLANEAIETAYGIEDRMLTAFFREVKKNPDGGDTVTYRSVEGIERMGVYTVEVKDGKVKATWSLDGKETDGGLDAEAWGKEQIQMMITDYESVMDHYLKNNPSAKPHPTPSMTYEEYLKAAEETKSQVLAAAKITRQQALEIGILALQNEYGLTDEQVAMLVVHEDEDNFKDEKEPIISIFYHLTQGAQWTEKDGIYVVDINMDTGVVEDVIYDSGLAANG